MINLIEYESNLQVYYTVMENFSKPPYLITIEKIKVFLTYQAKNNTTINTFKAYITSLSHYFKKIYYKKIK